MWFGIHAAVVRRLECGFPSTNARGYLPVRHAHAHTHTTQPRALLTCAACALAARFMLKRPLLALWDGTLRRPLTPRPWHDLNALHALLGGEEAFRFQVEYTRSTATTNQVSHPPTCTRGAPLR